MQKGMTERVTQLQWTIDGRRFRSREEYESALRDKQLVDKIIGSLSLDNPEHIEKIYHELRVGKYRFESIVGRQFDDNIYELYTRMKKQKEQEELRRRENIERKKQNMTRVTQAVKGGAQKKEGKPKTQIVDYDDSMRLEIMKVLRNKERKRHWISCVCGLLCVTCMAFLVFYYQATAKSEQEMDEILALKEASATTHTEQTKKEVVVHRTQEQEVVLEILPEYELLYQKNQNLIGWIKIDDTVIDYPVMQTTDNDFYLNHNFSQEEDRNGSIFMDYQCDAVKGNDNMILYGHHMKSGKMFGGLQKYSKKNYYEKHPYIQFDTIYEKGTYQVMYVFRSKVYSEEEITFKYYQFINAASEQEFISTMNEMAALSLYDTGVSASYGDKLLTLSTCDYQESKGRFVVVAKQVNNGERQHEEN